MNTFNNELKMRLVMKLKNLLKIIFVYDKFFIIIFCDDKLYIFFYNINGFFITKLFLKFY